jgi:predicted outer membrane protein
MKLNITMAILATLLAAGSLSAQQELPGQTQDNTPRANQSSPVEMPLSKEQVFAKCLAIANQEQVAIAKFAKEKSMNEEVKALATTLEKAHLECLDELKVLASKEAVGRKGTNLTPPAASTIMHAVDFLQMHQEMSDQCLKDSKEMLSKKEGADFDACFIGMEIAKHSMMHSSLTVLQRHTTGELQGFIKASLAKNDEHLKAATSLMEKLTDKSVVRTAKAG